MGDGKRGLIHTQSDHSYTGTHTASQTVDRPRHIFRLQADPGNTVRWQVDLGIGCGHTETSDPDIHSQVAKMRTPPPVCPVQF